MISYEVFTHLEVCWTERLRRLHQSTGRSPGRPCTVQPGGRSGRSDASPSRTCLASGCIPRGRSLRGRGRMRKRRHKCQHLQPEIIDTSNIKICSCRRSDTDLPVMLKFLFVRIALPISEQSYDPGISFFRTTLHCCWPQGCPKLWFSWKGAGRLNTSNNHQWNPIGPENSNILSRNCIQLPTWFLPMLKNWNVVAKQGNMANIV